MSLVQLRLWSAPGHQLLVAPLRAGALLIALAIALAIPGAAVAVEWPQARPASVVTSEVVTSEYQFTPDKLVFRRGVAYRLHLENHGKEMHEFNAPEFFRAVELGDPAVLNADRTEIALHPGEAKDLDFVPQQTGHFRLICPDHDWAGMTGEIAVE